MSGLLLPNGQPAPSSTPKAGPSYDDLSPEEKAKVDALAAKEEPELTPVTTAFAIVVERDGSVSIASNLDIPIVADREASPNDILGALKVVTVDVESHVTAMKVQSAIVSMQQQMAQQIEHARLAERLNLK